MDLNKLKTGATTASSNQLDKLTAAANDNQAGSSILDLELVGVHLGAKPFGKKKVVDGKKTDEIEYYIHTFAEVGTCLPIRVVLKNDISKQLKMLGAYSITGQGYSFRDYSQDYKPITSHYVKLNAKVSNY